MKDCTYYDLLGVAMDATDEELMEAKNFLVKKFHPDANMNSGFDTTPYVQNVLNAYNMLINPDERSYYDRHILNPVRRDSPASERRRKRTYSGVPSPNFAPYWEAANKLNGIVTESQELLKQKPFFKQEIPVDKLNVLVDQAAVHVNILEEGRIPRQYWYSYAMNWLLFQWSQNRDLPYDLLFSMYDSYLEQNKSGMERRKLNSQTTLFLINLDKLITSKQVYEGDIAL